MLRNIYLTCLLVILSLMAWGGTPVKQVKVKPIIKNDTTIVTVRHFDTTALKNYSAQKEFHYDTGYVGESLWSRFWRWFWSLFQDEEAAANTFSTIINYTLIALGVAALVFLILKLVGVDIFNIIRRKPKTVALPYDEFVEDIYAVNLDAEIEKAASQQNYRFAVRLLYLRSLKQLSDANLIQWDVNKTNSIYINELTNAEQRFAFKILTRQFEYVWYGELTIDAQVFKKINDLFTGFKIKMA
jgi:hypothetical protein